MTILESGTVGSLDAGAGSVTIDGTVPGDATVGAERLVVGATGVVAGDLRYDAGEFVNEGTVDGRVICDESIADGPTFEPVGDFGEAILGVYGFLVNLVLGAILLLVLVAVPFVLVLFAITIIGIPITLVGALLFAVLAWVGTVYGRLAVGEWLTDLAGVENRWLALLVGFLTVAVAVRVPWMGWLFELVVFLLGFGALALVTYEAYRGRSGEGTDPVDPADPDAGGSAPPA